MLPIQREVVRRLNPANIIVYGNAPEDIVHTALDADVNVVSFPTVTQLAHAGKVAV